MRRAVQSCGTVLHDPPRPGRPASAGRSGTLARGAPHSGRCRHRRVKRRDSFRLVVGAEDGVAAPRYIKHGTRQGRGGQA